MVSFPPVSPPRPYAPPFPHPYAPHAQPISFFSILSTAQYWVRSEKHLAPRYAVYYLPYLILMPFCLFIYVFGGATAHIASMFRILELTRLDTQQNN